jgi:hypothetical protein
MKSIYNLGEQNLKLAKSIITLILLITLLVLAIREQNITKNIINDLLYQEERLQMKNKIHR